MRVRRFIGREGSVPSGKKSKVDRTPFKALLWTALAGLIFGLIGFGEIAEDLLRTFRNSLHWHKASGEIVLVKIDDEALRQVGRWPWPRRNHAQLTDTLTKAGAKRIFFDISFFGATNPVDDRQFADAIKRSNRVVLALRTRRSNSAGRQEYVPLPAIADTPLATIDWQYNWQNAVWQIPYS